MNVTTGRATFCFPYCNNCKKIFGSVLSRYSAIRDEQIGEDGLYHPVYETSFREGDWEFTHDVCPECYDEASVLELELTAEELAPIVACLRENDVPFTDSPEIALRELRRGMNNEDTQ